MKYNADWAKVAFLACMMAGTSAAFGAGADVGSNKPVSDSYVTTKVKAALTKDRETKAKDIHVKTINGVVSLRGTARSESEKAKAGQDARRIHGVSDVHNDLTVKQSS
ncbi:MAG TPA: BON domain-containing protein [Steroidobacteraceae bacterium]|jgi:hyperosmotically inducible protein